MNWKALATGSNVYRVYNPTSGDHLFTTSTAERDNVIKYGWKDEGIAFKSGGKTSVYRIYNPKTGEHFYTASTVERDNLKNFGWNVEGVAFYGI